MCYFRRILIRKIIIHSPKFQAKHPACPAIWTFEISLWNDAELSILCIVCAINDQYHIIVHIDLMVCLSSHVCLGQRVKDVLSYQRSYSEVN